MHDLQYNSVFKSSLAIFVNLFPIWVLHLGTFEIFANLKCVIYIFLLESTCISCFNENYGLFLSKFYFSKSSLNYLIRLKMFIILPFNFLNKNYSFYLKAFMHYKGF